MIGIALGVALLAGAGFGWPAVLVCAGGSAIFVLAGRYRASLAIALVVAASLGASRVGPAAESNRAIDALHAPSIRGRVATGPVQSGTFTSFSLEEETALIVCVSAPLVPKVGLADLVHLRGSVTGRDDASPALRAMLLSRGCDASFRASRITVLAPGTGAAPMLDRLRQRLTHTLQSAFPGDSGALLAGLVTGDDAFLAPERSQAFVATGTSHVTAVSGSNLATLVSVFALLGAGIGGSRSMAWQGSTLVAIWVYVGMIGAPPPAYRAAVVATLAIVAARLGRRPDFVTLTLFVAAVQVVLRPDDFGSLSYRLSVAATLGLVLSLDGRFVDSWRGVVTAAVVSVIAAQVATAPITMHTFGTFTPWSVPANLVIGPLCAVALPIAFLAALLGEIHPMLGVVVAAPAALIASLVLNVVSTTAELPGSGVSSPTVMAISMWPVALASALIIVGISPGCRGGARALATSIRHSTRQERTIAVAGAAGSAAAAVALFLR